MDRYRLCSTAPPFSHHCAVKRESTPPCTDFGGIIFARKRDQTRMDATSTQFGCYIASFSCYVLLLYTVHIPFCPHRLSFSSETMCSVNGFRTGGRNLSHTTCLFDIFSTEWSTIAHHCRETQNNNPLDESGVVLSNGLSISCRRACLLDIFCTLPSTYQKRLRQSRNDMRKAGNHAQKEGIGVASKSRRTFLLM